MNKELFIKELKNELAKLNVRNVDDILSDYNEHFAAALRQGKTEEEVTAKLGSPQSIAQAFAAENLVSDLKTEQKTLSPSSFLSALGKLIIIAPFNFFILAFPGSLIFSCVIAGWSLGLATLGVGLSLPFWGIKLGLVLVSIKAVLVTVSTTLFFLSLGVFALALMFVITKWLGMRIIDYIQWTLNFVLSK